MRNGKNQSAECEENCKFGMDVLHGITNEAVGEGTSQNSKRKRQKYK
jgi:hypothetical protein